MGKKGQLGMLRGKASIQNVPAMDQFTEYLEGICIALRLHCHVSPFDMFATG